MEFWFDDARKTLIAVHDGCAVGIRPIQSGIEFFTPEYRVMISSGNLIFPGYILERPKSSDFGISAFRAFFEQWLTIRRFMSVITPGVIPEECSVVHTYSRDAKMYPEIDNDGFLTIRLLTGESCRMALTAAGIAPDWSFLPNGACSP